MALSPTPLPVPSSPIETLNPFQEPVELDPRLRRRPLADIDFNAVIWAMKTRKVRFLALAAAAAAASAAAAAAVAAAAACS